MSALVPLLICNQQYKIRLSDIDAPEKKQPYGKAAKWFLSDLIYKKIVTVQFTKKDRYKRIIGRVYLDNIDINKELVRSGYAWVYRRYSKNAALMHLEENARAKKIGLWKDDNPIYPSDFRHK